MACADFHRPEPAKLSPQPRTNPAPPRPSCLAPGSPPLSPLRQLPDDLQASPSTCPCTDSQSVSSGTSSARPITEVRHPENLLTEPFSLNCKQIGEFECDAISLQSNSLRAAQGPRLLPAASTRLCGCPSCHRRAGRTQYLFFLIKLHGCVLTLHRYFMQPSLLSRWKFLYFFFFSGA